MIPTQHTIETPYMVGPVHLYTLEHEGGFILIDTGPPTDTGRTYLREHFDLKRLTHVLVTHCHIDHYGQAGWLAENSDAVVYVPGRDIMKHERLEERLQALFALFGDLGFDGSYVELLRDQFSSAMLPPFPKTYDAAENLPADFGIGVLGCPGHSQSDLVYVGEAWAVTGDTLLRGIFQSPLLDIDLEEGGRFRNYDTYCSSIIKLAGLESKTVLPGHRVTVDGAGETIRFYIAKMLQRLQRLAPHLKGNTVAQVIERVFPAMTDTFHIYLKASEIVFMLDLLEKPELLSSALKKINLYEPVADVFEAVLEQEVRLN